MTKKHFIALADSIKEHNRLACTPDDSRFTAYHLETLAEFCKRANMNFNRDRWFDYINGECGPNGGPVKAGR